MKSLRESKGIDLAELDLFALALFAGLLAFAFWRSEKWMHQHVFKVGWLLSRNHKTTVVFYYTAFLPGVFLHELITWLTAGVCNVRATRAVQLPQQAEIEELQLGFVRIANVVHPFKRLVIELAPLAIALLALWYIAADILDVSGVWAMAVSGNLDDVARAISQLTATADFWLWFYLAFTIANTMMPALPSALQERRKLWLAIGAALLVCILFGMSEFRSWESIAAVERLLSSLTIILLVIMCFNLVMVLLLGALEALIERATGHSAAFVGGKLRTVTRQEARRLRKSKKSRQPRQPAPTAAAALPKSIYALPLPIPDLPGIEPVSRDIAAVLDLRPGKGERDASRPARAMNSGERMVIREEAPPARSLVTAEPAATILPSPVSGRAAKRRDEKEADNTEPAKIAGAGNSELDFGAQSDERAPFNRPFVGDDSEPVDDDETVELNQPGAVFARPFSAPTDAEAPRDSAIEGSAISRDSSAGSMDAADRSEKNVSADRVRSPGKTKPAPKPSQKPTFKRESEAKSPEYDELRYEPLDDEAVYDDDAVADDSS